MHNYARSPDPPPPGKGSGMRDYFLTSLQCTRIFWYTLIHVRTVYTRPRLCKLELVTLVEGHQLVELCDGSWISYIVLRYLAGLTVVCLSVVDPLHGSVNATRSLLQLSNSCADILDRT